MPSPRHLCLAALVALAGCDLGVPTSMSDGITAPVVYQYKFRSVSLTWVSGSVIAGDVLIQGWDQPSPYFRANVQFPNFGPQDVGARYPMHIHSGRDCLGVGVPVVHDLGAPASIIDMAGQYVSASSSEAALPAAHLISGYYFDVHKENDPSGVPLGCAIFPW